LEAYDAEAVEPSFPRSSDVRGALEADWISGTEKRAFEEQKWKLQLAMGENLHDAGAGEEESAVDRRRRFLRAVEGDDWSAVVNEQTLEAVRPSQPRTASPFELGGPVAAVASAISRELTVANVEAVLKPLRPVLLADGGDLEVLGVNAERGVVMLGLLGACTTCPAAPATMEGGIEKALHDHFGADVVREVVRVDSGAEAVSDEAVRRAVAVHLSTLEDSLSRDGASVRLLPAAEEEQNGRLEVQFSGSPMLLQLVQSSLTYRFPELAGRLRVGQASDSELAPVATGAMRPQFSS
jgi:Fe-S cluster biogenesis protein NfuA